MGSIKFAFPLIVVAALTLTAGIYIQQQGPSPPTQTVFSHFECYNVDSRPPIRDDVALTDQFGTRRFQVDKAVLFCTPVLKKVVLDGTPLPAPTPLDHLTCYLIGGDPPRHRVLALNQLDQQKFKLGTVRLLCVPTHKIVLKDPGPGF